MSKRNRWLCLLATACAAGPIVSPAACWISDNDLGGNSGGGAPAGTHDAAAPTIDVGASRTTCAAPCAVYFDATGTTGLAAWPLGESNDYVNATWSWNFDDPASAHDRTIGFAVAHVFE